jgi:hypothetical protein
MFSVVRSTAVSGQKLGEYVPAETDTNATIGERCFLCGPCRGIMTRTVGAMSSVTRVEAGSNTSTVILRVVGGDEKGSLKYETVKYGRESQGTALARASSIYKRQNHPLVRESAPQKQDRNCQRVINIRS